MSSEEVKQAIIALAGMTAIASITPGVVAAILEKMRSLNDSDKEGMKAYIDDIAREINNQTNKKQDILVSGVNIKTINGQSVVGEGNLSLKIDFSSLDNIPLVCGKKLEGNLVLTLSDFVNDADFITRSEALKARSFGIGVTSSGIDFKYDMLTLFRIPLATKEYAGLLPPASYQNIQNLVSNVGQLSKLTMPAKDIVSAINYLTSRVNNIGTGSGTGSGAGTGSGEGPEIIYMDSFDASKFEIIQGVGSVRLLYDGQEIGVIEEVDDDVDHYSGLMSVSDKNLLDSLSEEIENAKTAADDAVISAQEAADNLAAINAKIKELTDSSISEETTGDDALKNTVAATALGLSSLAAEVAQSKHIIDDDSDADLNIGDGNGNVILEIKGGHIRTKYFDSRNFNNGGSSSDNNNSGSNSGNTSGDNTPKEYAERPAEGGEKFTVNVAYKDLISGSGEVELPDYCILHLPETYSKTGNPTRLIISCAGTGEQIVSNTTVADAKNFRGWNAFLNAGYAVLDCNGIAQGYHAHIAKYNNLQQNPWAILNYGNPYVLQSYKKAYDYVINKYNIAKDGCFVNGISHGGLASFMIVQSGLFNVIAHTAMAPVTDIFKQAFLHDWSKPLASYTIPACYNFDKRNDGESDKDWFIRNIDKVGEYNSLIKNTVGIKTNLWTYFGDEGEPSGAEESVYGGLAKTYPCPLKIYHAKDDPAVAYRYSHYMAIMIGKGSNNCELVSYETGGHGAGFSDSVVNNAISFFNSFNN